MPSSYDRGGTSRVSSTRRRNESRGSRMAWGHGVQHFAEIWARGRRWQVIERGAICFNTRLHTLSRYIPTGLLVIRIFRLYTDYTTNAGAITMFLGWTKLWEEDVERVWGSFETGKWLWWVCRRRRAEIAGALERLVLAECPGDDSSVRAESSVDGARRSVDHSNTTVVSAKASAVSGGTTTHNSDGTCKQRSPRSKTKIDVSSSSLFNTYSCILLVIFSRNIFRRVEGNTDQHHRGRELDQRDHQARQLQRIQSFRRHRWCYHFRRRKIQLPRMVLPS